MRELDEVIQFIIDAISANAAKGHGSLLTIRVAPYSKKNRPKVTAMQSITADDVLDAHEALKRFDGDFRKLFETKK